MNVKCMVPLKRGIEAVGIIPAFGAGAGSSAPRQSLFAGIQRAGAAAVSPPPKK